MKQFRESEDTIEFDLKKMEKLATQETFIKFMANDLAKRNGDIEYAYRVVFNSEVLGDLIMEGLYKSI